MKATDLEIILSSLAETILEERSRAFRSIIDVSDAQGRAMDRLVALWEINDILNSEGLSKRQKLHEIAAIVDGALTVDADPTGVPLDWEYQ